MKPLITNIQRFCVHDGPGIRTTVFFKGCSLHCLWCANPENISFNEQYFYIKEKCSVFCKYVHTCKTRKTAVANEEDILNCCFGAIGKFGKHYSNDELFDELVKDVQYYGNDGGVTFSGGESLLFLPYYDQMVQKLREKKINTCVETALFVPKDKVEWAIENIDFFYVDIKVLEEGTCHEILGGDTGIFLSNLKFLYDRIGREKIIYRMPIIAGITLTDANVEIVKHVLNDFPPKRVEIFSVHNLGKKKYERLNKEPAAAPQVGMDILSEVKKCMETTGNEVVINSI